MISLSVMFDIVLFAVAASFVASVLIVLTERWHGVHTLDNDLRSIQKVHKSSVPRIGGIALLAGLVAIPILGGLGHLHDATGRGNDGILLLLLAAAPAFAAGSVEDITKKVSVRTRLLATFISALLAAWLLDAQLTRFDIWGLDNVLDLVPVSFVLTAFAVGGVTNSINIIDGFNGVAGGAVVIILSGLAFLASQAGDAFVTHLALAGIGATLGFLLLNYPTGRLFMGDGGAYLIGFWVAEVAVLTVARNPEVNAWQVLAICAYPVIEVVFSMYRRKIVRKTSVGKPDRLHLHTLVYRRLACQLLPCNNEHPWIRNAAVACFVATWIGAMTVLALWLADDIGPALALVLVQTVLYMVVYTRLVRGHWCRCLNPAIILGLRAEPRARTA